MHNISKKSIQELANQLAAAALIDDTSLLLEKGRELYERITLLHYSSISESEKEVNITDDDAEPHKTEVKHIEATAEELSVQERIQQIMDTAPDFESKEAIETPEKDALPTTSIEDEFKDAISADYAADLFESAEKIEITKKSLNDQLSQKEIQIGLNDRIAFVKHLFKGSQSDFTRVLSQLNSFETEAHAKQFIKSVVKPDYNWDEKIEYEERFVALIERKFL